MGMDAPTVSPQETPTGGIPLAVKIAEAPVAQPESQEKSSAEVHAPVADSPAAQKALDAENSGSKASTSGLEALPPNATEAAGATPALPTRRKLSDILKQGSASTQAPTVAQPSATAPAESASQTLSAEDMQKRAVAEQAEAQALLKNKPATTPTPAAEAPKVEAAVSGSKASSSGSEALLPNASEVVPRSPTWLADKAAEFGRRAQAEKKVREEAKLSGKAVAEDMQNLRSSLIAKEDSALLEADSKETQKRLAAEAAERKKLFEQTSNISATLNAQSEKMTGVTEQMAVAREKEAASLAENAAAKKLDLSEQYAEKKKELAQEVASLTEKLEGVRYESKEGETLRAKRAEALEKLDDVETKKEHLDTLQTEQRTLRKQIGEAAEKSMRAADLKRIVQKLEEVDAKYELAKDPNAIEKKRRLIENFRQREGSGNWIDRLTGKGLTAGEREMLAREEKRLAFLEAHTEKPGAKGRASETAPRKLNYGSSASTPQETYFEEGRTSAPDRYSQAPASPEQLANPEVRALRWVERMTSEKELELQDLERQIVLGRKAGAPREVLDALRKQRSIVEQQIDTLQGKSPEQLRDLGKQLEALEQTKNKIEARAMEKGPSVLDRVRKVGEFYKSLPWQVRLGAGIGLGALAVSGGGLGALVGVSGSMLQRFMGGAASFITAEAYLNSPNKAGVGPSETRKKFITAFAATFGVLMGTGAVGSMLSYAGHGIAEGASYVAGAAGEAVKSGAHLVSEGLGTAGGVLAEGARAGANFVGKGVGAVAGAGAEGLRQGAQYASENFAPAMQYAGETFNSVKDKGFDMALAGADTAQAYGTEAWNNLPSAASAFDTVKDGTATLLSTAGDAAIKTGINLNTVSEQIRA